MEITQTLNPENGGIKTKLINNSYTQSRRRTKCINIRLSDLEFQNLKELLNSRNIRGTSISERVRKMFDRDFELYSQKGEKD